MTKHMRTHAGKTIEGHKSGAYLAV